MTQYLRQSTAATLKLGPFVDTDGAATTGLTISQADVRLSKNGGNMAQKNESTSCTHDEIGLYDCPVDTTDTNTLGRLDVAVAESGALVVVQSYNVIPATIYDQMFAASFPRGPVLASGTLGATGNSTTALHLTGLAYADDAINGNAIVIFDVSAGLAYSTYITDFANTGDLATVPTLPFTPEASVDTYIVLAAKKDPDVATILADTNELQTDLANGGRLDLLIDAIKAKTDGLPSDPADASDIAAAFALLQTYAKNVAVSKFGFAMYLTDGTLATGVTVTGVISKDGGNFASITDSPAEIQTSGCYEVDLAQAEMNADEILLKFTATGCRPLVIKIRTQA